jgi:hypothetical protein
MQRELDAVSEAAQHSDAQLRCVPYLTLYPAPHLEVEAGLMQRELDAVSEAAQRCDAQLRRVPVDYCASCALLDPAGLMRALCEAMQRSRGSGSGCAFGGLARCMPVSRPAGKSAASSIVAHQQQV